MFHITERRAGTLHEGQGPGHVHPSLALKKRHLHVQVVHLGIVLQQRHRSTRHPVVLPVYLSSTSRVPFRYLNTRFAAIQCYPLAPCKCFPNDHTANAMFGRVTKAAYNKPPTSFMLSLSGLISSPFIFVKVPSMGVKTGLQSAIPNFVIIMSI
ncbi:hypothetical protein Naga_100336g3 [Nannochloropsis gaditana]|uniref:Uncharacterized protein n=1 Tax=Nannochloropsis gaditana TaxID=72520 RepID=W7T062_9STRA|nr:hypothetical protein Naga_100336g3 [Nannochloropsis gaditana]